MVIIIFIASGLNFDILEKIQLIGSYTYLFGPGNNSFDENLKFLENQFIVTVLIGMQVQL